MFLQIPPRTARRYIESGRIAGFQHPLTGTWKIRHRDLVEFMEAYSLDTSALQAKIEILVIEADTTVAQWLEVAKESWLDVASFRTVSDVAAGLLSAGSAPPDVIMLTGKPNQELEHSLVEALKQDPRTRETVIHRLVRGGGESVSSANDVTEVDSFTDVSDTLHRVMASFGLADSGTKQSERPADRADGEPTEDQSGETAG